MAKQWLVWRTGIVEEERIVGPSIFDEPMHCAQNILLGRLAHGVLLVVGQYDHVFTSVSKVLGKIGRHVANIVDASAKLAALAKIVDADEEGLASASALRVFERVALGSTASEVLRRAGRCLDHVFAALLVAMLRRRAG